MVQSIFLQDPDTLICRSYLYPATSEFNYKFFFWQKDTMDGFLYGSAEATKNIKYLIVPVVIMNNLAEHRNVIK